MIIKNGAKYLTVEDAAKIFGVSTKTVHDWIRRKVIDEPPQIEHGLRSVYYFPEIFVKKAKADLQHYKEKQKAVKHMKRKS
jgi:hypothetical protein